MVYDTCTPLDDIQQPFSVLDESRELGLRDAVRGSHVDSSALVSDDLRDANRIYRYTKENFIFPSPQELCMEEAAAIETDLRRLVDAVRAAPDSVRAAGPYLDLAYAMMKYGQELLQLARVRYTVPPEAHVVGALSSVLGGVPSMRVQIPAKAERVRALPLLTTSGGYSRYQGHVFGLRSLMQRELLDKHGIHYTLIG